MGDENESVASGSLLGQMASQRTGRKAVSSVWDVTEGPVGHSGSTVPWRQGTWGSPGGADLAGIGTLRVTGEVTGRVCGRREQKRSEQSPEDRDHPRKKDKKHQCPLLPGI